MSAVTPYRITPSLGPDLWQSETQFYWDQVSQPHGVATVNASYQPGSTVVGQDGRLYRFVVAGAAFAAGDGVSINESTWVASADASSPVWTAPVAVASGEYFHARSVVPLAA